MGGGPLLCEKIYPNLEEAKQRESKSAVRLGRGEGQEPVTVIRTCVTGKCCKELVF